MKLRKKIIVVLSAIILISLVSATGCSGSGDVSEEYLAWTGTEWDVASNEEKKEALKAVLLEVSPDTYEGQEDILTSSAEAMIPSMDAMFETKPDTTLKKIVENATTWEHE